MQAIYRWWATWVFVAIIVQIGLAGYGAFYVAGKTDDNGVVNANTSFDHAFGPHIFWGYFAVGVSILVLTVIGLVGGIGKWRLGRQGILFLLFFLQVVLAGAGDATPYAGFFHPVNALVIFTLSGSIVYTTWKAARSASTERVPEAVVTPT
jgi:hypothetical protein